MDVLFSLNCVKGNKNTKGLQILDERHQDECHGQVHANTSSCKNSRRTSSRLGIRTPRPRNRSTWTAVHCTTGGQLHAGPEARRSALANGHHNHRPGNPPTDRVGQDRYHRRCDAVEFARVARRLRIWEGERVRKSGCAKGRKMNCLSAMLCLLSWHWALIPLTWFTREHIRRRCVDTWSSSRLVLSPAGSAAASRDRLTYQNTLTFLSHGFVLLYILIYFVVYL